MAHTTPHVEQDRLRLGPPGAEQTIAVGSPAWFTWLETATAFTFTCSDGMFTARRERASSGRGGWYWRAEQRRGGVRRRAYLGKPEELTLEQLRAVAASLTRADAPAYIPVSRAVGASAPVVLPRGTVTFLFTDIEGSTQLWEQHKEAMRAALARHDLLLRQAIDAHNGAVFKTVGDSVYAAFVRAPDALVAALAAQRALQQEAWQLPTPLRVRMALHSGAAELRDGDYFGPPLNRLARLLNLGHGGQILLSRATHDLVVDELPKQTSLRALGDYHLKDLARPELIFQCVSTDLPADFPPLRMDGSRPSAGVPAPQLLATKLYMPLAQPTLVARPRLLERLQSGLGSKLTLIAASAGFGKTTLLASWLGQQRLEAGDWRLAESSLASSPHPLPPRVAWLSLDTADNDPATFLRYLIAALQTIAPQIGATALALLQAPQLPPLDTLVTMLLNDATALPHESLLVLDDYHVIATPAIHQALAFLLDHLPPQLHLIIASREDPPLPLARLRARRQLAEIRAADLRFTSDEAAAFLNEVMGLSLSAEDIVALETRTEGWIAGLQLAALSLQGVKDRARFIEVFSGSNRYIVDYLVEEVLHQQPEEVGIFLLQTSILGQLCGPLCDAIVGQDNQFSGSQAILEHLERANLFLISLDDERKWYRYHHLFADVLRTRLQQATPALFTPTGGVAELHHRASLWYERHGFIAEAIEHALATGTFEQAIHLIEHMGLTVFAQGAMQYTLQKWLAALPVELVRFRPKLCLTQAWLLLTRMEPEAALHRLEEAGQALRQQAKSDDDMSDARNTQGEIAATRALATTYGRQVDLGQVDIWVHEALEYLRPDNASYRGLVFGAMGIAAMQQGDLARAGHAFAEGAAISRAAGHEYIALATTSFLTAMQGAQGALSLAIATCRQALDWAAERRADTIFAVGNIRINLAELLRERNDLTAALRCATLGVACAHQGANPYLFLVGSLALARVKHALGDSEGAIAAVDQMRRLADQQHADWALALLPAVEAQLRLAHGDMPAALEWAASTDWAEPVPRQYRGVHQFLYTYEYGDMTRAQVLIAQAWSRSSPGAAPGLASAERAARDPDRLSEVMTYLDRQGQVAADIGLMWLRIKVHALQSLAYQAGGDRDRALAALTRALSLAAPEGYVRVFVDEGTPMATLLREAHLRGIVPDYTATLLAAFPDDGQVTSWQGDKIRAVHDQTVTLSPPHPVTPSLVESLTTRELAVLRLLAAGASNADIARELVVEQSTVKKHLIHIYGKLGVHTRTQAVAHARALQLLD